MTPMRQQIENPRCSACGDEMELTVLIPPFGSPHGLKVFTCPKCGRSEDYLGTSPSQAAQSGFVAATSGAGPALTDLPASASWWPQNNAGTDKVSCLTFG